MLYVIESVPGEQEHVNINPNGYDRIVRVHPVTDWAAATNLAVQLFAATDEDDERLVRHTLEELFMMSTDNYCVQIVDTEAPFDRDDDEADEAEEVEAI